MYTLIFALWMFSFQIFSLLACLINKCLLVLFILHNNFFCYSKSQLRSYLIDASHDHIHLIFVAMTNFTNCPNSTFHNSFQLWFHLYTSVSILAYSIGTCIINHLNFCLFVLLFYLTFSLYCLCIAGIHPILALN